MPPIGLDIFSKTWRKRREFAEKLQIADRLKDDFLMNTSHELRNPLHGMINIAQNVLDSEKTSMDAKNAKNMELLISVGRRMSFMLNDLLDLNRLRDKGLSIQIKKRAAAIRCCWCARYASIHDRGQADNLRSKHPRFVS